MRKIWFWVIFLMISTSIWAQKSNVSNLGSVAKNLNQQVDLVSNFVYSACLLLGVAFLFASFVKYLEHRKSPLMVTMSTVVFLIIAGIVFVLLSLLQFLPR